MRFVSFFIPATVQAKAGLRTKRRMPFILGANLFGMAVSLSCTLYLLIIGAPIYFTGILLGAAALFAYSIILERKEKFATGAYFLTASLFLLCTSLVFLRPAAEMPQILYRLIISYLTIGTLNLIIAIRRRQLIGFFAAAFVALIIFFTLNLSADRDALSQQVLFFSLGALSLNAIAQFLIYSLNEGIYRISHTQMKEAENSLEKMKGLVENVKDSVEFSVTLGDASNRLDAAVTDMEKVYQYLQSQSDSWEKISDGLKYSFDTVLEKMHDVTEMLGRQNVSINQSSTVLSDISEHIDNVNSIASQRRGSMFKFLQRY